MSTTRLRTAVDPAGLMPIWSTNVYNVSWMGVTNANGTTVTQVNISTNGAVTHTLDWGTFWKFGWTSSVVTSMIAGSVTVTVTVRPWGTTQKTTVYSLLIENNPGLPAQIQQAEQQIKDLAIEAMVFYATTPIIIPAEILKHYQEVKKLKGLARMGKLEKGGFDTLQHILKLIEEFWRQHGKSTM